jgi:heme/copper-type cytochrome/quinol oxidase subunit 2
MEGIIDFHHDLTYIIVVLSILVGSIMFVVVYFCNMRKNLYTSSFFSHNMILEII